MDFSNLYKTLDRASDIIASWVIWNLGGVALFILTIGILFSILKPILSASLSLAFIFSSLVAVVPWCYMQLISLFYLLERANVNISLRKEILSYQSFLIWYLSNVLIFGYFSFYFSFIYDGNEEGWITVMKIGCSIILILSSIFLQWLVLKKIFKKAWVWFALALLPHLIFSSMVSFPKLGLFIFVSLWAIVTSIGLVYLFFTSFPMSELDKDI